jgi:hypothetical protein
MSGPAIEVLKLSLRYLFILILTAVLIHFGSLEYIGFLSCTLSLFLLIISSIFHARFALTLPLLVYSSLVCECDFRVCSRMNHDQADGVEPSLCYPRYLKT